MKIASYRLGFIGFGHMAKILCERIIAAHLIPRSQIQFVQRDRDRMKANEKRFGITATSLSHIISSSNALFICVRPAQMAHLATEMASFKVAGKKILSLLAGIPISFFQKLWGSDAEIARVMPNVASAIGEGMTILSFSETASREFKSFSELLVAPFGKFLEISESQMDLATAIAGSGPGFVFQLIRAMAEAGEKGGLSPEQALLMASQTFLGASRLVASGADLSTLLTQIATPGGTTEAGFQVMHQARMAEHFQETITAAVQKAKALAK